MIPNGSQIKQQIKLEADLFSERLNFFLAKIPRIIQEKRSSLEETYEIQMSDINDIQRQPSMGSNYHDIYNPVHTQKLELESLDPASEIPGNNTLYKNNLLSI